jgi:hypothetical protein
MFLGHPDPLVRGMDPDLAQDLAPDPKPSLFSKVLSGLKDCLQNKILT